ncbi:MAG: electron transport complex subunit RsxC [Clostridia bacterium]|nr:electron transport complex subunit RsxC [Clostridia bacterium]
MDFNCEIAYPAAAVRGGAEVPHLKSTAECESVLMPSPATVFIPMSQHIGAPCEPCVKVEDEVFVGTLIGDSEKYISAPIYSSVSGKVTAIEDYTLTNGAVCKAIVIESDGLDTPCPDLKPVEVNTIDDLVAATRACGLVGLGGAGFPTHVKLAPKDENTLDTLIINGAECEPYITSDYRSCMEDFEDIIEGVYLLKKIIGFKRVLIAVEDNKPAAIEKLAQLASDKRDEDNSVKVLKLPSRYPQGAEKVLIYTATKRRLPLGALPSDVGCMVLNITSVATLYRYIRTGMPLVKKRITVDGTAIAEPKNLIVPIGTRIADVIDFCGGFKCDPAKVLYGGPMMGVTVESTQQPVLKQNNAILAFADTADLFPQTTACINCGRCHRACPMKLMPCSVEAALKADSTEALTKLHVNYCMECGCCSYSCPAKRPLTQVMRLAKQKVRGGK